jgi:hypothetical protein
MHNAMSSANSTFLIDDPQFAIDFAPNGMPPNLADESLLVT